MNVDLYWIDVIAKLEVRCFIEIVDQNKLKKITNRRAVMILAVKLSPIKSDEKYIKIYKENHYKFLHTFFK